MNRCCAGIAAIVVWIGLASFALAQVPSDRPHALIYLAKGAPNACGADCDTWIAISGEINRGDSARFISFMQKFGGRKLPVALHSPGGNGNDAMVMGRMLQSRGMRALVGRTIPRNCTPMDLQACSPPTSADTAVEARISTEGAACSSSCVWLLLGAAEREVPPAARIGIHSTRMFFISRVSGERIDPAADPKLRRSGEESMQRFLTVRDRYFRDMGIGMELARAADEVPHETIKVLSRAELFRFGVDRREFGNTSWVFEPSRVVNAASTTLFRKGWGGGDDFSSLLLRVSCTPGQPVELTYTARGEAHAWPMGDVVVRFGSEIVRLVRRSDSGTAEDRTALLSRNDLARIVSADKISIAEDASGSFRLETPVSGIGFSQGVRRLLNVCGAEAGRTVYVVDEFGRPIGTRTIPAAPNPFGPSPSISDRPAR